MKTSRLSVIRIVCKNVCECLRNASALLSDAIIINYTSFDGGMLSRVEIAF